MTLSHWKIWYGSGGTASSRDTTWEEAPSVDVQIVMVYYQETYGAGLYYRDIFHGCDFWWFDGQQFGITDDRAEAESKGSVKEGRLLPDNEWADLYARAYADLSGNP